MVVMSGQIDAETVPSTDMTVLEMGPYPSHQITGQADVVERLIAVQGVDARLAANKLSNCLRILLKQFAGDSLEMTDYEAALGHPFFSQHRLPATNKRFVDTVT
jgi:hypothetical protein